jgi:dolichol-phosphate mannosyltransferase
MKKISIILSTLNESECIENTIILLKKNIPNLEILIVDDNSSDGTFSILQKFENQDIKIIQRKKTKGLASAFLCGLINTTGEIVGWIDSNMGELSNKFPEMLQELNNNDIVLLSRYLQGGNDERNKIRVFASKIVNKICKFCYKFTFKSRRLCRPTSI